MDDEPRVVRSAPVPLDDIRQAVSALVDLLSDQLKSLPSTPPVRALLHADLDSLSRDFGRHYNDGIRRSSIQQLVDFHDASGFSQKEVAARIGMTESTYSRRLGGKTGLDANEVAAISLAFPVFRDAYLRSPAQHAVHALTAAANGHRERVLSSLGTGSRSQRLTFDQAVLLLRALDSDVWWTAVTPYLDLPTGTDSTYHSVNVAALDAGATEVVAAARIESKDVPAVMPDFPDVDGMQLASLTKTQSPWFYIGLCIEEYRSRALLEKSRNAVGRILLRSRR